MKKEETKKLTIRLPIALWREFKGLVVQEDTNMSDWVREKVEKRLAK